MTYTIRVMGSDERRLLAWPRRCRYCKRAATHTVVMEWSTWTERVRVCTRHAQERARAHRVEIQPAPNLAPVGEGVSA